MSNSKVNVSTIIVAAGKGTRMNMDINKQYIEVGGKPLLARTLQVFEDNKAIKEIVLVVNQHDIMYCKQNIIDKYGFMKIKAIVSGGTERQDSVFSGLSELSNGCDIVLIHDGARPFVREESIQKCIQASQEHGAACVAVPVKDTIKKSGSDGFISETLDRSTLWSVQTPQGFKHELIVKAHHKAREDRYKGTDDTVLAERLGVSVKLVMGSYDNIKITTQEDLVFAKAIADIKSSEKE